MKKIPMIIISMLLIISTNAYSTATSDLAKITLLRGFNDPASKGVYFTIDKATPNPHNCTSTSLIRASEFDIVDFDQQFALLMAAFIAGKNVKIQIDSTSCSANYPKFVNVIVYP